MSNETHNIQFPPSDQDTPNIYDVWALLYSTNGGRAKFWRHSKSNLPRFYDTEDEARSAGGLQISRAGIKGDVAIRPVLVKVFVALASDLEVNDGH